MLKCGRYGTLAAAGVRQRALYGLRFALEYVSAGTVPGARLVSVHRGLEYFFADVAGATQHRARASNSGTPVGQGLTKSEKISLPALCHFGTARKRH